MDLEFRLEIHHDYAEMTRTALALKLHRGRSSTVHIRLAHLEGPELALTLIILERTEDPTAFKAFLCPPRKSPSAPREETGHQARFRALVIDPVDQDALLLVIDRRDQDQFGLFLKEHELTLPPAATT